MKTTPLHDLHLRLGARFTDFAGWRMPLQYQGILQEHRAVRNSAGLFDVSHMGEIAIGGPDAEKYLNFLLTNDVSRLRTGRALYSPMCLEDGGTVDDLIVWRRSGDGFLLCVNAANLEKDLAWMREWGEKFSIHLEDVSAQWGLLALQGPRAADVLQAKTPSLLGELAAFSFSDAEVGGIPCMISRTGYTGEDGFEIFVPAEKALELAEMLLESGKGEGVSPAGLGARDTLRLEAGFALYGHELSPSISPLQAGLGWTVKFSKPAFLGRQALWDQKVNGLKSKVLFFRTGERRIPRAGTPVSSSGRPAGQVLSGTISPILNEAIGSALVDTDKTESLTAETRGSAQNLIPVTPPFHRLPARPS